MNLSSTRTIFLSLKSGLFMNRNLAIMIYIFTALKSEAQAFVDKYKLKKEKINNYTLYKNDNIVLIISGLGVDNTKKACEFILNNYKIAMDDIFINIGICASRIDNDIGKLLEIGKINYNNETFTIDKNIRNTITCLDYEAHDGTYELVDMESYGFYEILHENKNLFIFKVVSDHFEPETITKEKTKALIFNVLDEVFKKIVSHSRL